MAVDAASSVEALKGNPPSRKASPDVKTLGDKSGGQEKVAKEIPHPGAGETIFDRLKNLRVSRRKVFTGAVSAGAGVAALVALDKVGLLKKEEGASLEKSIPNLFESVRSSISSAAGSEELRAKLLDRVSEYESANNTLNEIRQAHESFVEPDGTPTLVTQTRARLFGKADMTAFWKGKFANEREFIEDQVYFLKPLRYQKVLITDFMRELGEVPNKRDLESYKALVDSKLKRSDIGPGTSGYTEATEFERAFNPINDLGSETPKKGQIEVKAPGPISPSAQNLFEQDKQKVLARIGSLPFPEDITVIISSNRYGVPFDSGTGVSWQEAGGTLYRDESGKMVLSLRVELDDYSSAAHEAGHYFEVVGKFMKPKDLVAYEIAIERVLSDPKIGRNYPDIALLFNKDRQNAGATDDYSIKFFGTVTSPELFRYTTGNYPDRVWVRQARQGPLTGDKGIFGDILPYRMVDSFSKQTPIPFEGFEFSKFVASEKGHFDQLAASDPVWAYVVGEIRKNPQQFDSTTWARSSSGRVGAEIGSLPTFGTKGIDYASYWKSMATFGQAILAEGFFRNEPVVTQALSNLNDEAKKRFLNLWRYNLMGQCDEEKWAETFSLAISHPELLPTGTSFNAFFNLLRNTLRPTVAQVLPNQK